MTLLSTTILSGAATLTRLISSLILSKIIALYIGPAGFGIIGQFQNLVSMLTTFASGATSNGVIKLTAENQANRIYCLVIWKTAISIGLICSTLIIFIISLFYESLATRLLTDKQYSIALVLLVPSLTSSTFASLFTAVLNGLRAIPQLAAANILGSLTSALLGFILISNYGLWGGLVAVALAPTLTAFILGWMFWRTYKIRLASLFGGWNANVAHALSGFSLMAATTAVAAPIAQMIVREALASTLNWETAGLWQAMIKISETHLMLLTTTLSVYFLPRYAEITNSAELSNEVRKAYTLVVPIVFLSAVAIYILRHTIIEGLLSAEFYAIADVMWMQLIGDFLKVSSWVVSFTMVSHARTRTFVATEALFTILYVLLCLQLIPVYGLIGTSVAYTLTYLTYWGAAYFFYRRLIAELDSRRESK